MLKIRQIDPKLSRKCITYCKIHSKDKTRRNSPKIILLVPKPTGQLLPSYTISTSVGKLPPTFCGKERKLHTPFKDKSLTLLKVENMVTKH